MSHDDALTRRAARQRAKAERLEQRAAGKLAQAEGHADAARAATGGIPMGQPILVGHHSERRHRRDLERSDAAMGKAAASYRESRDLDQKAATAARRAEQAEAGAVVGAVASSDPDAVELLKVKLEGLERRRELLKSWGAAWRKARRPAADDDAGWRKVAEALQLDVTGPGIRNARKSTAADPLGRGPVPGYMLANLGSEIRRLRKRIEALRTASTELESAGDDGLIEERDGAELRANPERRGYELVFPSKPPAEVLAPLRACRSWRYSRNQDLWYARASDRALAAGREALAIWEAL